MKFPPRLRASTYRHREALLEEDRGWTGNKTNNWRMRPRETKRCLYSKGHLRKETAYTREKVFDNIYIKQTSFKKRKYQSGKCKLKPLCDLIFPMSKWLRFFLKRKKKRTGIGKGDSYSLMVEVQTGTDTLETRVEVPQKARKQIFLVTQLCHS